jgi:hypothetical protein
VISAGLLLTCQVDKMAGVADRSNVLFCMVGFGVYSKNKDMPKGETAAAAATIAAFSSS